jgi:DNA-binding CsgD family transcriptional regulator/PAS domain-containing protein
MFAERHSNAIRKIYASLDDTDDESRILDILRDCIGAEHVLISRLNADAKRVLNACDRLRGTDLTLFDPIWKDEPTHIRSQYYAPGQAIRMTTLAPAAEMMQTELYQTVIRPIEGGLSAFYLHHDGDQTVQTIICRSVVRQHDFDADDLAAIDLLMPHVVSASTMLRKARAMRQAADDAHELLDLMRDGIFVLDSDRRVIHANASARALAASNLLHLTATGIHAPAPLEDARLQAAIRSMIRSETAANGPRDDNVRPYRLTLSRAPGQLPLTLRVVSARSVGSSFGERAAAAVVLIAAAGETAVAEPQELVEQYGLTQREAQLALELSRYADLAAAAGRLGITIGTARQYLKSVFEKTNVRNQASLLQVLRG